MKPRLLSIFLCLLLLVSASAQALTASDSFFPDFTVNYPDISSAQAQARAWFHSLNVPFSFKLDGEKSASFIDDWSRASMEYTGEDGHLYHTLTFQNPESTLEIRVEAVMYQDVPTVEWVVYAKNIGSENSGILRDLMGLDVLLSASAETSLLTANGALGQSLGDDHEDFLPVRLSLTPGDSQTFAPYQGRSTNGAWPYYNLRFGEEGGVMLAIGWSGQWIAHFDQAEEGLRVRSGMQTLNTFLYPGEEIRTPSYSLTFYNGTETDGQNMLRRVILSHYAPLNSASEEKLVAPLSINSWGGRTETWMLETMSNFTGAGVPVDTVWMDAAWFGDHEVKGNLVGVTNSDWYAWTGDWFENPRLFPNGLSAIGEKADDLNLRFLLWLEPERCNVNTAFYKEHKDWCYTGVAAQSAVVNFGHPEALAWWIDYATALIDDLGLDIFRQDFNIDPGPFWRQNDENNRRGISEIRHIEGLYAFWDALIAYKPGLFIDNCASGGRRLDFEALKRSIPLWSSDYYAVAAPHSNPEGAQSHQLSLASWLPLFGTGFGGGNSPASAYVFRSHLAPAMAIPDDTAFRVGKMVSQAYEARPLMYGDFYPLTQADPYGDVWQAWEYFRPDLQEGYVAAFRRNTPENEAVFRLSGLDPEAHYSFVDMDDSQGGEQIYSGRELMEEGFSIRLGKNQSGLFFFSVLK